VPGRFPIFTDKHVQQRLVEGLRRRGWDVVRAIDRFEEGTVDDVLFEHAVKTGRVLVTNDEGIQRLGAACLEQGRLFPGLVFWRQKDYNAMTTGEIIEAFERLAAEEAPFAYPLRRIRPPARAQARERFKRGRGKRGG